MGSGFRLEGIREWEAALAGITARVEASAESATREAAQAVAREAQSRAPRAGGRLAGSIRVFGPTASMGKVEADVGADVPYGRRVELGFAGTDSLGRRYAESGRPFLKPAADAARIREIYGRRLAAAMAV